MPTQHIITIEYSPEGDDPESATVLLDNEPVLVIARGDNETVTDLERFASNAELVAHEVIKRLGQG